VQHAARSDPINQQEPVDESSIRYQVQRKIMMSFIEGLPKAELHVHLEGTLEPEHAFELAQRNGIELPYDSPSAMRTAYTFHDLPSFLRMYYMGMDVLRHEQDFYDLAYHYFQRAAAQNVVYVEPFFDPQAHTRRGVAFQTVIEGIHRAQQDAWAQLGVQSNLILCFLRDMSAESAAEHLELALPYRDWLVGVGLDSDEFNNPPGKFADVFKRARTEGFLLTMHCDVNQQDTLQNLRECLDLIHVDRIDHGVNALEDPSLLRDIVARQLVLTVCPISNRFVTQDLTGDAIRKFLEAGAKVTINSDDPAYFAGYMTENLLALRDEAGFSEEQLVQLTRNAFEGCWAKDSVRRSLLAKLDEYVRHAR